MKYTPEQILRYMCEKYNVFAPPLGVYLLEYFISHDLLKYTENAGRLTGVVIFRKVKLSKYDDRDRVSHDPKGECLFICELCADTKEDIADLEKRVRERIGKVKHIGMHRYKKLHFYDYNKYINKLLGKGRK